MCIYEVPTKISLGKTLYLKITMGNSKNEMGNCPFAPPPWLRHCIHIIVVHGAPRFANYYQDHMVLQRAPQRAVVRGYSDTSNTPITLTMNNKDYQTMSAPSVNTNEASIWSVTLDAQPEEGPFDVKVTQSLPNGTLITIVLHDVLFGDVIHLQEWLSKEPFGIKICSCTIKTKVHIKSFQENRIPIIIVIYTIVHFLR